MVEIHQIVSNIKQLIQNVTPDLDGDRKKRMYTIINPDTKDYIILGVKISILEKVIRDTQKLYAPSYQLAKEIFKNLVQTNVEEYKFAAFFLIDKYRKQFSHKTPQFFKLEYFPYCHTWSTCDSCCIRVLGPFLAKRDNRELAQKTIDDWSQAKSMWIKRASMIILLKIIMVHKDFDESYVFRKVGQMLSYSDENYIAKGIGWLLKTCSKYKPEVIVQYLIENRKRLSRVILRYASEKLPKEQRQLIMQK